MAVLFSGAGLAIVGTLMVAHWNVRQGNLFAKMASDDPKSRTARRPGR